MVELEEAVGSSTKGSLIALLGILSALGPFSTDTYIPGLPAVVADLHGTEAQGQLTLTAFIIGLALGQLVMGPISDAMGRRRPILAGLACYVVVALACALAPNLAVLIVLRLLQGATASAGVVIARAVVRDIASGPAAAAMFGRLMIFGGLGPILAPVIGAGILNLTDWRGLFVILAVLGVFVAVGVLRMPETLPPERRSRGGLPTVARDVRIIGRDRRLIGYALTLAFAFTAMFGFISAAPFILEDVYGLSPTGFGIAFGLTALGFITGTQIGSRLARRYGSSRLVGAGCALLLVGAAWMDVAAATHAAMPVFMISVLLIFGGVGTLMPNILSEALARHAARAGSAAALIGTLQYVIGGSLAPLAGIGGVSTKSVAILVSSGAVLAVVCYATLTREHSHLSPS